MSDDEQQGAAAQAQNEEGAMAAIAPTLLNSHVPLPPKLAFWEILLNEWKRWKQMWNSFEIVTGLKNKENAYRTATFITCIGSDALEIYNGLPLQATKRNKLSM